MKAFVFLGGAVEDSWPVPAEGTPGAWLDGDGLRACRAPDLPHWLGAELWHAELDGPPVAQETSVTGRRGRLLGRVTAWNATVAAELSERCAWRARDQAVRVVARHGAEEAGDALSRATSLDDVEGWARSVDIDALPTHAAFAADVAALARGRRPESWRHAPQLPPHPQPAHVTAANVAFCVAHTAGLEAADVAGPEAYHEGVAAERAWQSRWLVDRLGLEAGGVS